MFKLKEFHKRDHWFNFALGIQNQYEEDHNDQHCLLHIALFGYSWWIKTPQFFKPKEKWVDLYQYDWATERNGHKGYTETIRRDYGFSFDKEAIHVHYGIQPGSWSSKDPKNSDHTKVFWWPWRLEIVRHDLLTPDGDLYHRNLYKNGRIYGKHLYWYQIFGGDTKVEDLTEISETVTQEHYTKDGRKQNITIRLAGEEREWRPKCTMWLPIFKKVRRVVDCTADNEFGEKAGSWKGGLMGWSCEWDERQTMKGAYRSWYKDWNGI